MCDVQEPVHPRRQDDAHDADEDDAAEERVERGKEFSRARLHPIDGSMPLKIIEALRNESSQPKCPAE